MNTHRLPPRMDAMPWRALVVLLATSGVLLCLSLCFGAEGWHAFWREWTEPAVQEIVLNIRLPRAVGAYCVGALLALAGAIAQGVFRNPLADPYLLGSSAGAAGAVALFLCALPWLGLPEMGDILYMGGMGLSAFIGALLAVLLTLGVARGTGHTLRLLLAGVVVGMVLGAMTGLLLALYPRILLPLQNFIWGSVAFIGAGAAWMLLLSLMLALLLALLMGRILDVLALGDASAQSLGLPLVPARIALILTMAWATGMAVAHSGLIAFVGLIAPHLLRQIQPHLTQRARLLHTAGMGGVLLLASDLLGRSLWAPEEIPVGIVTALLGGLYLLWHMRKIS